ncbi:MAG: DUF2887 domain-containing protein [bacterium]
MATDKLFYKLANSYPATILKLLNIPDCDDYRASSFTFKEIENRRDIIFEKLNNEEVIFLETQGYDDGYFFHSTIIGAMLYCVQKKFAGRLRIVVMFLDQSNYYAASRLTHHFDGSSGLAFQPIVFIFHDMEDTAIGKELIALGHRAGHTKGHIEGHTEGHAEGLEEGKNLGSLKILRESVADLIATRWPPPNKHLLDKLERADDILLLKGLFHALLKARTRKQMETALDTALDNGKK